MKKDKEILRKEIIEIGRLLWDKGLVSGLNGNISCRVSEDTILLTGRSTCLGLLKEKDIVLMSLDGTVKEGGEASSERLLHTDVYKHFEDIQAIIHTHTIYTNAFFLEHESLSPRIFETKIYLGRVRSAEQTTPSVTDTEPVIELLKENNIAVLRNHGVVAIGKELFDCFLLIQALEDAAKIEAVSHLYRMQTEICSPDSEEKDAIVKQTEKRYKLFSQEQIDAIVDLVNSDEKMARLGAQTKMTMTLAVKLNETGKVYSFKFEDGRIVETGNDEDVEFLISADEKVWRAVFNREIDPFVATTQKKMNLCGDFARISKWYAPCSRLFELWQDVKIV